MTDRAAASNDLGVVSSPDAEDGTTAREGGVVRVVIDAPRQLSLSDAVALCHRPCHLTLGDLGDGHVDGIRRTGTECHAFPDILGKCHLKGIGAREETFPFEAADAHARPS